MGMLEIRGVSHRYAGAAADTLGDVSVSVAGGRMVSVVGPSGSGKSTLLRVAAGLEEPTTGTVLIDDADVAGRPTERRDMTVMFQDPLLFDHLDVAGNVGFAPRLAGAGRREARGCARRYLRLVHLEGFERRAVGSLSGGQQQRVALARALAAERGVLLLDEPFSSLDRELRVSMHDLLGEVRAVVSPTVLMVTHDLDEAALAESTVVLIDGVVHQQAPMTELYARPASRATARLLGGFTEVLGTARDGVHHSAWGRVPLADDAAMVVGEAVLVPRRETLRLHRTLPGSTDPPGPGIGGRVIRRRPAGARVIAVLEADDGTRVEVELAAADDVEIGSRAWVGLPDGPPSVWAIPTRPTEPAGPAAVG